MWTAAIWEARRMQLHRMRLHLKKKRENKWICNVRKQKNRKRRQQAENRRFSDRLRLDQNRIWIR